MNHSELAHLARRPRARRGAELREAFAAARVMVTWTPGHHDGAPQLAASHFELIAEPSESSNWTCTGDSDSSWVESLSAWRCSEIVLTARLGDNLAAKHRVLELAEFLTFKLAGSQPLIRVLFLPAASAARPVRNHA